MAAANTFYDVAEVDGPATHAVAITPNNSTDLATAPRGIYIGVAGDLKVDMLGGETAVTFVGLAQGVIYPLRVTRVYATGTTAASLIGLY